MNTYPYFNVYNPQTSIDRINEQINQLETMKKQIPQAPVPQPTNLTQNFQLAPTNNNTIKYANSIDEVQKNMVIGDTPFFSNDMSVVWIKNTKNEITTYELSEIVPKDEKDLLIESLMAELNEVKGNKNYEPNDAEYVATNDETSTTESNKSTGATIKESKSSSISRISKSKTK